MSFTRNSTGSGPYIGLAADSGAVALLTSLYANGEGISATRPEFYVFSVVAVPTPNGAVEVLNTRSPAPSVVSQTSSADSKPISSRANDCLHQAWRAQPKTILIGFGFASGCIMGGRIADAASTNTDFYREDRNPYSRRFRRARTSYY